MFKFIKRLFCLHVWREPNPWNMQYIGLLGLCEKEYVCIKCGKHITSYSHPLSFEDIYRSPKKILTGRNHMNNSNLDTCVLTKESIEKFQAEIMDEKAWAKSQREYQKKVAESNRVINRCFELIEDEATPEDIRSSALSLAYSTSFNGYPICSPDTKRKLEGWL